MTGITEFLLARVGEDEAIAHAAVDPERPGTHWHWVTCQTDQPVTPGDEAEAADREGISLRTVEHFPSKWAGPLPGFVVHQVDEADIPGALEHIAIHDPARVLAECAAKRAIIEWHKSWPVLVETPFEFGSSVDSSSDPHRITMQLTRRQMWLTEQEYRVKFGAEPPTAPILRMMAAVYCDHPDYDPDWRL